MIVIGAGFSASTQASTPATAAHFDKSSVMVVVVAPGESLWSIAADAAGRGDVRSMVDEIISVNSLAIPDVQVGQKLRVPSL